MLIAVAVANAIVWSGVILGLLLFLLKDSGEINDVLDTLEQAPATNPPADS